MTQQTSTMSSLTDCDLDDLSWRFLHCDYAGDWYAGWSLDERLTTFLHRQGLSRLADDGDLYARVLDRVMTHIPHTAHPSVDRKCPPAVTANPRTRHAALSTGIPPRPYPWV